MDDNFLMKRMENLMEKCQYIVGNKCFECGKEKDLHDHHIIPRSRGGERTIKLCGGCHGKVHDYRLSNLGELIKIGLEKAKDRGMILGRPKGTTISNDEILDKHLDIVDYILKEYSLRMVAKVTNKSISTVQRVKKMMEDKGYDIPPSTITQWKKHSYGEIQ